MLLTIAVPTYNRAYLLDRFFDRLYDLVKNYPGKFEILVSNNASIDETSEICKKWEASFLPLANFSYVEQQENIGVAKNIVYLFEHAQGEYLILLPDDDEIVAENFSAVLSILEEKSPSAIIQNVWNGLPVINKSGVVTYSDAANLFYVYGNAWAAIVHTQHAVAAIQSRGLKGQVENIVWPQTVMGFLAMHDAEKDIVTVDFEIGRNSAGCQNITNKKYWTTSFYGLLKAACIVDKETGVGLLKKSFFNLKATGFLAHINSIVKYSLISENISTQQVRELLFNEFGLKGKFLGAVFLICDYCPSKIIFIASLLYFLKTGKSPRLFYKFIDNERKYYFSEISASVDSKKRFGNWF